jgi:hypothetical protein
MWWIMQLEREAFGGDVEVTAKICGRDEGRVRSK